MRNLIGVLSLAAVAIVAVVAVQVAMCERSTPHREYHANGKLALEQFTDANWRLQGARRTWHENGVPFKHSVYAHGEVVSHRVYAEDGTPELDIREGSDHRLVPVESGSGRRAGVK